MCKWSFGKTNGRQNKFPPTNEERWYEDMFGASFGGAIGGETIVRIIYGDRRLAVTSRLPRPSKEAYGYLPKSLFPPGATPPSQRLPLSSSPARTQGQGFRLLLPAAQSKAKRRAIQDFGRQQAPKRSRHEEADKEQSPPRKR